MGGVCALLVRVVVDQVVTVERALDGRRRMSATSGGRYPVRGRIPFMAHLLITDGAVTIDVSRGENFEGARITKRRLTDAGTGPWCGLGQFPVPVAVIILSHPYRYQALAVALQAI
jgi:hypothetical protein